jgi:hypothetical protein
MKCRIWISCQSKHIKKNLYNKTIFTSVDELNFILEATSLASTKNPFLLRIVGFSPKDLSIVTLFLPNKDLLNQIPF